MYFQCACYLLIILDTHKTLKQRNYEPQAEEGKKHSSEADERESCNIKL